MVLWVHLHLIGANCEVIFDTYLCVRCVRTATIALWIRKIRVYSIYSLNDLHHILDFVGQILRNFFANLPIILLRGITSLSGAISMKLSGITGVGISVGQRGGGIPNCVSLIPTVSNSAVPIGVVVATAAELPAVGAAPVSITAVSDEVVMQRTRTKLGVEGHAAELLFIPDEKYWAIVKIIGDLSEPTAGLEYRESETPMRRELTDASGIGHAEVMKWQRMVSNVCPEEILEKIQAVLGEDGESSSMAMSAAVSPIRLEQVSTTNGDVAVTMSIHFKTTRRGEDKIIDEILSRGPGAFKISTQAARLKRFGAEGVLLGIPDVRTTGEIQAYVMSIGDGGDAASVIINTTDRAVVEKIHNEVATRYLEYGVRETQVWLCDESPWADIVRWQW
jgi:hypothetical protein